MKYSYAAAALAMATGVVAKPQIVNNSAIEPTEGKPFTVQLKGCESTCTIYLMQGPKDQAQPVKILDEAATTSSTITLSNVGSGMYGLRVQDNSATGSAAKATENNDYTKIFNYTGTGPTSFPPLGSTATATSTSSKASSTSSTDSESTTATDSSSSASATTSGSSTSSTKTTATTTTSASKTTSTNKPSGTNPPSAGNIVALSPIALIGAAAAAFFL
ncbi:hypothetical protein PWT90_06794 [Aphanocladium album]|nr:hypothetical protein PWT90_06794 [Aphanocladium album]